MNTRKTFLLSIVFALATVLSSVAEVTVLPAGTVLTQPSGVSSTLDNVYFLLSRDDMEKATLALETIPIKDKQIADLTLSWNTVNAELESWKVWGIVGMIGLPVVAVMLDELLHILEGIK